MARQPPQTVMTALGFSRSLDRIYEQVLGQSGRELVSIASVLLRTPEETLKELAPLIERGLVRLEGTQLFAVSPVDAISLTLADQAASAAVAHERLRQLTAAIPFLTASSARPAPGEVQDVEPLDGEVSSGGHVVAVLEALISQSNGDLLWLRPDQWRAPREDQMTAVVRQAVESGRQSRAIYPVRALSEAPAMLAARADAGEQIRVLSELPTRLLVIGTTHAILPEPLGFIDEPRLLIRQRGIVEALGLYFEQLWERAAPVVGLERGDRRPDLRRFLLQQMAAGAQDEQIARRLGVSLRTVRRRVADILTELGADTRFQAGAEAVRRGWL